MRVLGLDPGLRFTGWGVIDVQDNRLTFVEAGVIESTDKAPLPQRLLEIENGLVTVLDFYKPTEAAVEETFVNVNPESTLKLGMARGVVLMAPARLGIKVGQYSANHVKKAVVGVGHADKQQVQAMVKRILPKADFEKADAADALAVAICHAHTLMSGVRIGGVK